MFRYNSYHKLIFAIAIVIWAIFHFSGDDSESKYFDNGQIKKTGGYLNGKNHGTWIWYYENGEQRMSGVFIQGKRNGIWKTWDQNNKQLTEANYIEDKLNGEFLVKDAKGRIIVKKIYRNDILIKSDFPD